MGHIYTLAGPSGIGKTTFLSQVLKDKNTCKLTSLRRATSRPKRKDEIDGGFEGIEYNHYSENHFLAKLCANDFLHTEIFDKYLYGIEKIVINESLESEHDSIIMSGIRGALHLKREHKEDITILYMYPGDANTIITPAIFTDKTEEIAELERRLEKKYDEKNIEPTRFGKNRYIKERMRYNKVNLAIAANILRYAPNDINILINKKEDNEKNLTKSAIEQFHDIIEKRHGLLPEKKQRSTIEKM